MISFKGLILAKDFDDRTESYFAGVQSYIDNECKSRMKQYIPVGMEKFRGSGKMSRSTEIEKPGLLVNKQPRARREYYTNKGMGKQGVNAASGSRGLKGK
jgi:hypothetical protein